MANNGDNAVSSSSLFSNLRGLIWGAIIGVASFQLIAPNVWGYIHSALDLSDKDSYWIFTLGYFLSIPICILIWLAYHWNELIQFLSPAAANERIRRLDRGVLAGLFSLIGVQTLVTLVSFRWYFPEWVYMVVLGFYCLCCGALLVFYSWSAQKRIAEASLTSAGDRPRIRKYYQMLVVVTLLCYFLLFWISFLYLREWSNTKSASQYEGSTKSAYYAGTRGFALSTLKDSLDDRYDSLSRLEDLIRYIHRGDNLDSVMTRHYYVSGTTVPDTVVVHPDSSLLFYYTVIGAKEVAIDQLFRQLKDTATEVSDSAIYAFSKHIPRLGNAIEDSLSGSKDDLHYVEMLKGFLSGLSQEVDTQSKYQLGLQIGSVQVKGMILLIPLLFILLSLYIYLCVCQRLMQGQPGQSTNEVGALTSSLWVYITILVWLLVPLFKPVKDADINVKQTYKTHVLSY